MASSTRRWKSPISESTTALPAEFVPGKPMSKKRPDPKTAFLEKPCFKTPVPAKARSKRTRTCQGECFCHHLY
ncbi:hypothetical protein ACFX13_030449 [Malus domestica]